MSNPLVEFAEQHEAEVAFDNGRTTIKYGELLRAAHGGIAALRDDGVGQGDRIIWCPANDLRTLQTFWSLLLMGCVSCPISERFPDEKKTEIAKQLNAKWLPTISFALQGDAISDSCSDTEPATITLTSGSTGQPKAIVHSLAAHVASAQGAAINMPLSVGDRWLWSLPTYHVSGFSIVVRCATSGATIVGMNRKTELTAELLEQSRVTHLSLVSTQLRRLLADGRFPSQSLKAVLLGGSAVSPSLVEQARERGVPVHTTYGLTETASQLTTSTSQCHPSTSGRVLPKRELKIDAVSGHKTGEILVRGETLCLGYYRDGRISSVVDDAGWFHTNDRGTMDEAGNLTVAGRIDNMFISGGENIYPETIERALLELPGVMQAIVVPRNDEEFGARPVAFVESESGDPATWRESLCSVLRSFEIPVAFSPWPKDAELGIKPSRKKLRALVDEV